MYKRFEKAGVVGNFCHINVTFCSSAIVWKGENLSIQLIVCEAEVQILKSQNVEQRFSSSIDQDHFKRLTHTGEPFHSMCFCVKWNMTVALTEIEVIFVFFTL